MHFITSNTTLNMPFLREISPFCGIRAGIWHITESDAELRSMVGLTAGEELRCDSFLNELRKKQWLACRVLIRHLLPRETSPVIYDIHGKPSLASGIHHISFSHAGDCAAAVCSAEFPVGIDIEKLRDRVERVKERFMVQAELDALDKRCRLEHLYLHWCGKEALYKLNGKPVLDFRNDIYIHPFDYLCNTINQCNATMTIDGKTHDHVLHSLKMEDYMVVVAH